MENPVIGGRFMCAGDDAIQMDRQIAIDRRFWFGFVMILVCLCGWVEAQQSRFAPRSKTEFELAAYRDIESEPDLSARLDLTEAFLTQYPESELRHLVMRARWNVFRSRGETAAVLGITELALQAEIDFFDAKKASLEDVRTIPGFALAQLAHDRARVSYLQSLTEANNRQGSHRDTLRFGELGLALHEQVWEANAGNSSLTTSEYQDALSLHQGLEFFFVQSLMSAHEGLGNASFVVEYAERSLELDPDHLLTLITASRVMAQTQSEVDRAPEEAMASAEGYALRAIEQLDVIVRGEVGRSMLPGQIARLRSTVHTMMGLVYFQQQRYDEAESEYLTAIESFPLDPETHYRLGVAYANNQKADESVRALARAVYLNNPRAEARDALIRVYEVRFGGLEGLEEFIEAEGLALEGN